MVINKLNWYSFLGVLKFADDVGIPFEAVVRLRE